MKNVPYPEYYGLVRVTGTINMQCRCYYIQKSASHFC